MMLEVDISHHGLSRFVSRFFFTYFLYSVYRTSAVRPSEAKKRWGSMILFEFVLLHFTVIRGECRQLIEPHRDLTREKRALD